MPYCNGTDVVKFFSKSDNAINARKNIGTRIAMAEMIYGVLEDVNYFMK